MPPNAIGKTFYYRGHGRIRFTVEYGPDLVNQDTSIVASICEVSPVDHVPLLGDASMEVRNVVPHRDGDVDYVVFVDWDCDLEFRVTSLILNP